ncbi:type IV pilus modification PilV family protein [Effusibacillus lacus]|uniref:Prepilin-type N-terminal cleavage/methylation domain-containing protein n=1 Tax=Effusibacillus lacus TaxID=1348429 RepID=A0A292YNV0_9BACL|nr:hypothetical protein [Effusibacillus lacus]TCS72575.1 hypothetical protein EDD64_12181 [Effusibacillus lacus]GAX90866.1 prepilin-type N-terminal cleavage/methylation domain-containing protein [Effusibacillus lacus]
MNRIHRIQKVSGKAGGFSLLESVTAIFVLTVGLAAAVPITISVQSKERLAAGMMQASELAINELERALADKMREGVWTVSDNGKQYSVQVRSTPDKAGSRVEVQVSFNERGNQHAVSYEALLPGFR